MNSQATENRIAHHLIRGIEQLGLLIILIATVIAIWQEIMVMVEARHVRLADLLLLFIYLEVVAMIGIYYQSRRLPVRFPIYIALVALARYIILEAKSLTPLGLFAVGGTMVAMAVAILIIRFGHAKFPYADAMIPGSGKDDE